MLPIFVTKNNFHKLESEAILRNFKTYTNFSVRPLPSILSRFKKHIDTFSSKGLVFKINPEVPDILRTIEAAAADGVREDEILRMLGIITEDIFIGPESIHLDIVNYCNLKCIHCWFHSPLREKQNICEPNILPLEKIKQILHTAHKMGVFDILLLGCGETLMHPDIKEIINLFKEYNFHLTLFSNATLLNDELIESISSVKEGMGRFYFSINAGDNQTYREIHIGSSAHIFAATMKNIAKLSKSIKAKYNNPPKIIILHVLHKINSDNIHNMFQSAIEVKADELWFQLAEYTTETKHLTLNKDEIIKIKSQISKIKDLAGEQKVIINDNIDFQLNNVNPETGNWAETLYKTQGCYIGWDFMRIWNNGDVSFCCPPKYMGNVYKTDIDSLWNSTYYNKCRIAGKYFDKKIIL